MDTFKPDFFWMQRQRKGLYPWVEDHPYRLLQVIHCPFGNDPFFFHHYDQNGHGLISSLLRNQVLENDLLDLFVKAIMRAEIRLISRFVPQRSHEERLTGNLISEMDAALFLTKDAFREAAIKRYEAPKEMDFLYYDLSRGGKVEAETGADFGLIVVVDLPDHPFMVRSIILQAKKCDGSATIDLKQFEVLQKNGPEGVGYIFYDMDFRTLTSPMVLGVGEGPLRKGAEGCAKVHHKTFSLGFDEIRQNGVPLSLYLLGRVIEGAEGKQHPSFDAALHFFRDLHSQEPFENQPFSGKVGIVSIGKPINLSLNQETGLAVSI